MFMNTKKKYVSSFVAAALMFGGMSMAQAATDQGHGTVTFTGSIIEAPCSITPDSLDQTVELGQISDAQLKNGGTNDGSSTPRPFEIKLENCDVSALADSTVSTTFTGAEGAQDGSLGIAGTAAGASIIITNGSGEQVVLGDASKPQKIQDGNNSLMFAAYLKGDGASATITPGEFTSVADFTLDYQ